ncbi:MAG: elongation factor G [Candidatus Cloacimonetes bacterium]|nr:elongation factor G [Candidatus Cloacimonadota bacterium]MBS3766512.1 elongation factor G [Candidatus Cloacimonadota bacterium]
MKKFPMESIRNYALIGASGSGKTTLSETMLFNAGQITRVGKVESGNTVMDYTEEEKDKKMSLRLTVGNFEWNETKHNIIDSPGYSDFKGDMASGLRAVETALILIEAVNGPEVMTDFAVDYAERLNNAQSILINKMDRENAKYEEIIDQVTKLYDKLTVPVLIPIGKGAGFKGVINTITKEAFINGKEANIPDDLADKLEEYHESVIEAAAESDDALMEKFFEKGSLTPEEIHDGLKKSFAEGNIIPIMCCSTTANIGVKQVMNMINDIFPTPKDKPVIKVEKDGETKELDLNEYDKPLGFVLKTFYVPNQGDISVIRLFSGSFTTGDEFEILDSQTKNKVGQMYYIIGKKREDADVISAGDFGGLVKIKNSQTNSTIGAKGEKLIIRPFDYPDSVYWKAIKPQSQSDEDKIGPALSKIIGEDPSIHLEYDDETQQSILAGQGDTQINLVQNKLKNSYNIDAKLSKPRIPYKETIQAKAKARYRHKKQTGGHGEYGEVYIKIAPQKRGEGFEFIDSIVGGVIPSKFIPAVEKGLVETLKQGIVAGYPGDDISAELYDGSFHDVDSSEKAFKVAARKALQDAFQKAKPVLLEPIHKIKIVVPTESMGDVMGNISSIRGRILGMTQDGNNQVINAELPLSELYDYYSTLKSLTQGKGYFSQEFGYYQKLPGDLAEQVIQESKKEE